MFTSLLFQQGCDTEEGDVASGHGGGKRRAARESDAGEGELSEAEGSGSMGGDSTRRGGQGHLTFPCACDNLYLT